MTTLRLLRTEDKIYLALIVYCLFAFNSIKKIGVPRVDDIATNNVILVAFILYCLLLRKKGYRVNKTGFMIYTLFFIFCLICGFLLVDNQAQFWYAFLELLVPLLYLLIDDNCNENTFLNIFKVLNVIMVIYAIIAIYISLTFPLRYQNLGNTIGMISRIPMPVGSSITLSYYMNISLPIPLMLFTLADTRSKRLWYLFSTLINAAVTFMQMSRSAAITTVVMVIYYLLFVRDEKTSKRKIGLFAALLGASYYLYTKFDLSRLTISVFGNVSGFDYARYDALELAFYLFGKSPFWGTGIAAYFHRAWLGNNHLIVENVTGLIDPHNAFLLILSETGIIGTALFAILIGVTIIKVKEIQNLIIRRSGYLLLTGLLMNALAGSQFINEINYTCIAVCYLTLFVTQSRGDISG